MSLQRTPYAPPLLEKLHAENTQLEEENRLLQDVIEVLYVQNQQLSTCLNVRKAHDREQKVRVERLTQSIKELSSSQARNHQAIKQSDEERREHWEEFCQQLRARSDNRLLEHLNRLSDQILDRQYEEMIKESLCSEIVIGIKSQDMKGETY